MSQPLDEQSRERRDGGTLWSLYKWWDRVTGWSDWYSWFEGLLAAKSGPAILLVTTAAVTTLTAGLVQTISVALNWEPAVKVIARPIIERIAERRTRSTLIYAIEGRDKWGRQGLFDVVVARKNFLWVRGSSSRLEKDGIILSGDEIVRDVFDRDVRGGLRTALEVVAVGMASQEGDPRKEIRRAGRRAKRTAELVQRVVSRDMPVSTLNLGQFRASCEHCEAPQTNWQRPFVVIAVRELDHGTNLTEALGDALTSQAKLPPPDSYTTFRLERIRG